MRRGSLTSYPRRMADHTRRQESATKAQDAYNQRVLEHGQRVDELHVNRRRLLFRQGQDQMSGGLRQMAMGGGGAGSFFGGAGSMVQGAGAFASAIPGGQVIGTILQTAGAFLKAGEQVLKFGDALHETNMKFAEYSASMAFVQAEQQMRDIQLSQERGERRAGSARMLAGSRHRFNQRWAVVEDKLANTSGGIMSAIYELMNPEVYANALSAALPTRLGMFLNAGLAFFRINTENGDIPNDITWATGAFPQWTEDNARPENFPNFP